MFTHDDFTSEVIGFVYELTYSNGQKYIGRKTIRSLRRIKPTKEQLAIRKNYVRKEWKNQKFADYEGSHTTAKELTLVKKEIIELCRNKINLSYCEMKALVRVDALCNKIYLNDCIDGSYYRGKIDKGL